MATNALEKTSSLAESSSSKAKKFIRQKVQDAARYIEQPHVVIIFLLIVYMEIILESLSLSGIIFSQTVNRIRKMIMNLQCMELTMQLVLFPLRYFSHWGYCFDTALVSAKVFNGKYFNMERRHLHIASFLRVWRFVQVVQSFIVMKARNMPVQKMNCWLRNKRNVWQWKRLIHYEKHCSLLQWMSLR